MTINWMKWSSACVLWFTRIFFRLHIGRQQGKNCTFLIWFRLWSHNSFAKKGSILFLVFDYGISDENSIFGFRFFRWKNWRNFLFVIKAFWHYKTLSSTWDTQWISTWFDFCLISIAAWQINIAASKMAGIAEIIDNLICFLLKKSKILEFLEKLKEFFFCLEEFREKLITVVVFHLQCHRKNVQIFFR